MDFIQNVGQSYLERKAFAAPQMAENMMMKQFKGSDDNDAKATAKSTTAASHAGSSHSRSHSHQAASTSKKGSTTAGMHDKDAEIKSLRKQLDHYSLEEASQGHHDSEGERGSSVGAKSRHVAPSYVSTHKPSHAESRKRSASEKPRRSSGAVYLEKGGLSRKKSSSRKPSSSGAAKEAAKLVALDARLEKGGISTKKKSQAFAEVEEVEPVRHGSRYHSVSESESDSEDDDVRSHHTSRSKATVSDASTVRASRVAPSHRSSHSRGRAIEIVSPPASHKGGSVISSHAPSHHSYHDSHSRAPVSIISGHAAPSHRESHAPSYHHSESHSASHAAPLATIATSRAPSHVHSSRAPPSILSSQAGSHHIMASSPIVIAPRHSKSHTPSYYHHKPLHSASHAAPATIISTHSHAPSSSHSHHSKAPSSHHISHAPSSSHHSRAPSHHTYKPPTLHAASTRSPSPTPQDSDSDSLAPSDSITSIDIPSEHGGSAALLHQREKYHRSASRGRVPELPPLEERPECCGPGFVPCRLHRERLEEEDGGGVGGIVEVEVFEGVRGPAPHVREIGRGRERGWGRGRRVLLVVVGGGRGVWWNLGRGGMGH
ncbi:MAG: hypothetical protein OHK93_005765 [Ramalina farinacea]|uniref:Uncharacterized protein n=1 Tax=Ramalina farinacea TaxID=258253 RepID=A0AA43QJ00_9LECA|nr:hypothetical protein [Ramalina farinacea]